MTTQLEEKQLKLLIKESVKEVIGPEFMKLRTFFVPFVSEKEQRDIEQLYGEPSRKVSKSYKMDI